MNSAKVGGEPFSTTTAGESTIRAALLVVLLFFVLIPQIAWGFHYRHCCSVEPCGIGTPMQFGDSKITLERLRNRFPDGSDEADALEIAAGRWNSLAPVQLSIVGSNSTTISKNGVNEIGFEASEFTDEPETPAFVQRYTDIPTCKTTEADMYWNPGTKLIPVPFHALEDAQHSPYDYSTKESLKDLGRNMVGVAVHELGHVLGLQHNNEEYNIMGAEYSHINRNGDITYYGPGSDGAAGARFLYPPDLNAKFFDLGVSIFAYDGPDSNQPEYSSHAIRHWKNATNGPLCSDTSWGGIFKKDGVNCYDVDAGAIVQVPFTFENNSKQEETFEAVFYNVYISADNTINDKDTLLISYSHHLLRYPFGGVFETFLGVPIPSNLRSDSDWYLGVIVERQPGLLPPGSVPDEVDYKNNAAWYPFTIASGNGPPHVEPYSQPINVIVNTSSTFTPNVIDPEGDQILFQVGMDTLPSHGKVTTDSKKLRYTPDSDYIGPDSFVYRVIDYGGGSSYNYIITRGEIRVQVLPTTKLMSVNKTGNGTVTSNPLGIDCGAVCTAEFASGGSVSLDATPASGFIFSGWDGGCSGKGACTVVMNHFQTVSARFEIAPTSYTLTVGKTGTGSGAITSNPAGIDCGEDCTEDYPVGANAQITLTPNPDAGSTFRGWNGACSGMGACAIRMYADQNITATFATATPTIFTVNTLDDSGAGSLRQAILDANANPGDDTILFQRDLKGAITLTSGQLVITDSLDIDGPGANVLAISGNNASRIFEIVPGTLGRTVAINGLTLKEGNAVSGNGGGGIYIDSGTVTINNCTLSNNSAVNDSGGGGGIRNYGWLTISNSTLSNNTAGTDANGGAIRNSRKLEVPGALTVINSTLSGNSAQLGGGILIDGGIVTVSSSTITANSSSPDFGSGGGIFFNGEDGELRLSNSVVAGNQAASDKEIANGVFVSRGHNLFGENGVSGVATGITLAANDLTLAGAINTVIGPLADNGGPTQTHLPVAGGPAIDAGDNNLILQGVTTDQRGIGFPRIVSGTIDIGAVEKIIKHTLSISKTDGIGTITSDLGGIVCGATCSVGFISGATVTLTAIPDPGYLFTGWGGACSGPATTCTLAMDAAKNVTASFVWLPRSSWKRALVH